MLCRGQEQKGYACEYWSPDWCNHRDTKKSGSSIRPNSSAMKLDTLSTNLVSAGSWKRRKVTWLWSRSVPIPQCLASMGSSTAAEAPTLVSQWAQLQDSWLPQNTGWEGIPSPQHEGDAEMPPKRVLTHQVLGGNKPTEASAFAD